MAGRKSDYNATYISDRKLLRTVTDTDSNAAAVPADELVSLAQDSINGRDGEIILCAVFPDSGVSALGLSLYLDATGNGDWCFVGTASLTASTMCVFFGLPVGNYAVAVSTFTGSGSVKLYAQHT